jgi:hypothetical protein
MENDLEAVVREGVVGVAAAVVVVVVNAIAGCGARTGCSKALYVRLVAADWRAISHRGLWRVALDSVARADRIADDSAGSNGNPADSAR